ncbi:hypothetical protein BUALT_Bualt03G0186300 [Buddleja alternifolia]|uniref:Uncharacterized protein n=1 Tax=Buddleja alternifolia TaxID=168488 RepID=A0AAV6Y5Q3_9LAMI|nr:hypothetical protein BUALT_Bualt03G0186300 [Buddleja alternifolia]
MNEELKLLHEDAASKSEVEFPTSPINRAEDESKKKDVDGREDYDNVGDDVEFEYEDVAAEDTGDDEIKADKGFGNDENKDEDEDKIIRKELRTKAKNDRSSSIPKDDLEKKRKESDTNLDEDETNVLAIALHYSQDPMTVEYKGQDTLEESRREMVDTFIRDDKSLRLTVSEERGMSIDRVALIDLLEGNAVSSELISCYIYIMCSNYVKHTSRHYVCFLPIYAQVEINNRLWKHNGKQLLMQTEYGQFVTELSKETRTALEWLIQCGVKECRYCISSTSGIENETLLKSNKQCHYLPVPFKHAGFIVQAED